MKFHMIRVSRNGITKQFEAHSIAVVVTKDDAMARDVLAIWYRRRYDRLPTRPRGGMFVAELPEGGESAMLCVLETDARYGMDEHIVEDI